MPRSPAADDRLGVYYGFKSMNSHIHLLEALTELSRVDRRPVVKERLRESARLGPRQDRRRAGRLESLPDARLAARSPRTTRSATTSRRPICWSRPPRPSGCPRRQDLAGRPQPGRSCARLGLGRRARRLLRQGRVVRRRGVRPEEGLVDRGRGAQRAPAHAPEVRRATPTATAKAFLKQWDFIEKHLIDPVHGGWYAETDARRQADRRRRQGQPVEGQLSHLAGPDERGDDAGPARRRALSGPGTSPPFPSPATGKLLLRLVAFIKSITMRYSGQREDAPHVAGRPCHADPGLHRSAAVGQRSSAPTSSWPTPRSDSLV